MPCAAPRLLAGNSNGETLGVAGDLGDGAARRQRIAPMVTPARCGGWRGDCEYTGSARSTTRLPLGYVLPKSDDLAMERRWATAVPSRRGE